MAKSQKRYINSWKLIAFEDAHIHSSGDDFFSSLIVEGISPYINLEVDLIPLIYSSTPEYWGIEVVGCLRKFALPGLMPYQKVLPLDFQIGSKGIEVIGAEGQSITIDCSFEVKINPDDGGKRMVIVDRQAMIEKLKRQSKEEDENEKK